MLSAAPSGLESLDGPHNVDLTTAARDFVHNPFDIHWLPRTHTIVLQLYVQTNREPAPDVASSTLHQQTSETGALKYSMSCSTCSVSGVVQCTYLLYGMRVITLTVHKIW